MAEPVTPKKPRVNLSSAWGEMRALLIQHRVRLLIGLVLLLINRAASLVLPYSSKLLFDEVIRNHRVDLLAMMTLAVTAAVLVDASTSFALTQMLSIAAQRAINDLRKTIQDHVLRLPVRSFDATQTGVLISRIMTDAEGVRNLVGTGIVQLVGGVLTAGVAISVLFYLSWQLTSGIIVLLALYGGVLGVAFKRLRPVFRERGKLNAEITGRLNETLGGIRIIKAYVAEPRERAVFGRGVDELFVRIRTTMTGISGVTALSTLVIGLISVLAMQVGGRSILAGTMTTGDLVMYIAFTALVAAPVFQMASIGTQITEAFAGLDRIRELRQQATEDADDATKAPCPKPSGAVSFQDVYFAYEPGQPVLKGITFEAPQGSTTALVGSSGSGKSTLVSLVMAFNRPYQGKVLIDGRDLASVGLRDYRRHLGVVMQDNFLFDGTIADNIAFARPDATRAQVEEMARIASCDEFIRGFPQGYDTVVGERGIKLSGGQRQRVAIARALLADPAILILDEATSSLDSESEAKIQAGLEALRKGRTSFVIAHRLSTIRAADQILVLEGGVIVERGTHEALIALDGRYRQLHDRQFKVERERYVNPGEELTGEAKRVVAAAAR
jgi:subfamily B ATP-binding cassette protein MsbA